MKILIVGMGSVGRKHCDNLDILGYKVDVCDPKWRAKRIRLLNIINIFDNLTDIKDIDYDLVIIGTPTSMHLEHIAVFDGKVPYIVVEKPLAFDIPTKEYKSQIFINHAYRFERGINKLKELINDNIAGKLRHVSMENSYSFKKLHPYSFASYEGILYDDSHMLNTSRYLFGEPDKLLSKCVSKEFAQWNWLNKDGIIISHMTDVLNERYKKRIEVKGERGTLIYNFRAHEIFFSPSDESERRAISYKHADHLFESLKYVIDTANNKGKFTKNTVKDAIKDLEVLAWLK